MAAEGRRNRMMSPRNVTWECVTRQVWACRRNLLKRPSGFTKQLVNRETRRRNSAWKCSMKPARA